jgi:hypothetical protein
MGGPINTIQSNPLHLAIIEIQAKEGKLTCPWSQREEIKSKAWESCRRVYDLSVEFMLCCLCPADEPEGINCAPAATRKNLHGAKNFTNSHTKYCCVVRLVRKMVSVVLSFLDSSETQFFIRTWPGPYVWVKLVAGSVQRPLLSQRHRPYSRPSYWCVAFRLFHENHLW